ncbi:MAG TPA: hypothetical protein VIP77_00085 [Jiangellaceae bacterium]
MAHPHIDRGPGRLVVSYNVHSAQTAGRGLRREDLSVHRDVSIYRPRFVTVQFDDAVFG